MTMYLPNLYCRSCDGTGGVEVTRVCCGPTPPSLKECGCSREGLVLEGVRLCECVRRSRAVRLPFRVCDACRGHGGDAAGGEWHTCQWCLGYGKRRA